MSVLTRPKYEPQKEIEPSSTLTKTAQSYFPRKTPTRPVDYQSDFRRTQMNERRRTPYQISQIFPQPVVLENRTFSSTNPTVHYPYDERVSQLSILKDQPNSFSFIEMMMCLMLN